MTDIALVPRGQPKAGLIEQLERMLEHARSGEMTGLACFIEYRGSAFGSYVDVDDGPSMVGYLEVTKLALLRALMDK